jgi:hypothetical protein
VVDSFDELSPPWGEIRSKMEIRPKLGVSCRRPEMSEGLGQRNEDILIPCSDTYDACACIIKEGGVDAIFCKILE